ncbi:MAG: histidinol-phosphate transaminase [Candidatus Dormibacteria bacterium]
MDHREDITRRAPAIEEITRLARTDIVALTPYSSARVEGEQARMSAYLDANENPFPPFPATPATEGLNRYPEPQPHHLLERFSTLYGVAPESLFFSRGADEAIDLLVRIFCAAREDAILVTPPAFPMYRSAAHVQGAAVFEVPLLADRGFQLDPEGILACHRANANIKLIFVCSPNNPTANLLRRDHVLSLARCLWGKAIVVADQTYVDFSGEHPLSNEIATYPNLVVLRTLSKEYSLAGERFGISVACPEIIGLLRKVMAPYGLTQSTIRAVSAAVTPEGIAYAERHRSAILDQRNRIARALASSRAVQRVWPSDANFIVVETSQPTMLVEMMASAGIKIRDRSRMPGMGGCVRISAGLANENDAMLAVFGDYASKVEASSTVKSAKKQ